MRVLRWESLPAENISGTIRRQVVWGEQGTLARFRFEKGVHVSPHRHPAEQFTCLVAGSMRIRVGAEEVTMRAGDMVVVPSATEHEVWVLEDTEVIDFFSPARDDWRESDPVYLRQA